MQFPAKYLLGRESVDSHSGHLAGEFAVVVSRGQTLAPRPERQPKKAIMPQLCFKSDYKI